ncbi:alkaline phosphatase family protein [Halovalidus salilacus]|uniref:alkaline phosphatase family protein n=1 Tax=Halovalidus salilacus TaxID=3075124 RepID=UPI00360C4F4C
MARTIVIGLDGGNWELISPWLESGELPNIARLIERGATATSHSYLPPVTVPNWKCYSTGKNPGKLSVYRFDHLDVRNENYVFHHSTDFKSAELWDYLNDEGYRTAVVNMPTTYPPREIDGAMICGGPDAREGEYRALDDVYTYPESLQKKLEAEYDYAIHPKPLISSKDERGEEVDAIQELIDLRFRVAKDLLSREEFDFLHVTSFYSNTLQHFFWQEEPVFETWKLFDDHIGDFLELEDTNVIVMSDHGCENVHTVVHLNNWLEKEGYLSLETSVDDVMNKAGLTKERVLQVSKKLGATDTLARIIPEKIQNLVPWEEGVRGKRTFEKINWEETDAVANAQGLVYVAHEKDSETYNRVRSELLEKLGN